MAVITPRCAVEYVGVVCVAQQTARLASGRRPAASCMGAWPWWPATVPGCSGCGPATRYASGPYRSKSPSSNNMDGVIAASTALFRPVRLARLYPQVFLVWGYSRLRRFLWKPVVLKGRGSVWRHCSGSVRSAGWPGRRGSTGRHAGAGRGGVARFTAARRSHALNLTSFGNLTIPMYRLVSGGREMSQYTVTN